MHVRHIAKLSRRRKKLTQTGHPRRPMLTVDLVQMVQIQDDGGGASQRQAKTYHRRDVNGMRIVEVNDVGYRVIIIRVERAEGPENIVAKLPRSRPQRRRCLQQRRIHHSGEHEPVEIGFSESRNDPQGVAGGSSTVLSAEDDVIDAVLFGRASERAFKLVAERDEPIRRVADIRRERDKPGPPPRAGHPLAAVPSFCRHANDYARARSAVVTTGDE